MLDEIKEIIYRNLGEGVGHLSEIEDLTSVAFFGSLTQISIAADLEERFGISLTPEEIEGLDKVSTIIELVSRKISG